MMWEDTVFHMEVEIFIHLSFHLGNGTYDC